MRTNPSALRPGAPLGLAAMLVLAACAGSTGAADRTAAAPADAEAFGAYWYTGEAELTRYTLEQSRYGAIHPGHAVLIFVTEDFLAGEQVKYEGHGSAGDAVSVLKLNFTRKFDTGIYPYSMMSSVFTPVDGRPTLKTTTSVQEWCGHTYTQLNHRGRGYRGRLHSYFQDEADREFELGNVTLEDELWTRIRLSPASLPLGDVTLVPGLQYARLSHRPSRAETATATLETVAPTPEGKVTLRRYRVVYRDVPRVLQIDFEAAFPHTIAGWVERDARGGDTRQTRAERTHTMRSDYWNHNAPEDGGLRKQLGLD